MAVNFNVNFGQSEHQTLSEVLNPERYLRSKEIVDKDGQIQAPDTWGQYLMHRINTEVQLFRGQAITPQLQLEIRHVIEKVCREVQEESGINYLPDINVNMII